MTMTESPVSAAPATDMIGGRDHKPFRLYARGERRPFDLGGDDPVVFGALRWCPIDAVGNVTLTAEGLRDLCNYVYRDGWRFGNMAPRAETPAPLPPGAVDFKSMPAHKLGPEWVGATRDDAFGPAAPAPAAPPFDPVADARLREIAAINFAATGACWCGCVIAECDYCAHECPR